MSKWLSRLFTDMETNFVGIVAAISAFLGIWFGHVGVRKIDSVSPTVWFPTVIALALGSGLEYWSLNANDIYISTSTGILGMTILWDALEFARQHRRVVKGHAPANPSNPRHARILAKHSSATTLDLLKRDPIGRQVQPEEAIQLVTDY
jgi:hypothetical protein